MIKNFIGAIGMTLIGTMPTNRADYITNSQSRTTAKISKNNIYTVNEYDEGILTISNEVATIQYEEININNNIKIINRARIKTDRVIDYEGASSYGYVVDVLTEIQTNINLTTCDITYNLNPPLKQYLLQGNSYEIGHFTTLTNVEESFINGNNYNSWSELANLQITSGKSSDDTASIVDYEVNNSYGPYNYYYLTLYFDYDDTLITDGGSYLLNNEGVVNTINFNLEWQAQIDPSQYEVIDLPGLMFEILGMPFAWFSTAFNFTLFPGTPYAINISHLLLGLLVSLMAIIIFRIIWKGRS